MHISISSEAANDNNERSVGRPCSLGSCLVEVERIVANRLPVPLSSDAKQKPLLKPNSLFRSRDNGLPEHGGAQSNYLRL